MTKLLYLEEAYLKETDATLLEVIPEGEQKWRLILDRTLFYPMGGGQSTDQGTLTCGSFTGKVYQALLKEDRVVHYVESSTPPPVGSTLHLSLDWDRRYLHMRLHSAGHLVDFAMYQLGLSPAPLMPFKGDHGKKPSICYQGTLDRDFREELEREANRLVEGNLLLSTRFASFEEMEKSALYLQPGLPKNKPLRLLHLEGVGSVADGGTQVSHTSEVGKIAVLPLTCKDGVTTVHYRIQP